MTTLAAILLALQSAPVQKPALSDFLGTNGHFHFRPKLYRPAVKLVRNYHSMEWDTGKETNHVTGFPFARNRVNWETVYGAWKVEGFVIDASVMFANLEQKHWTDPAGDARRYGKAFSAAFGPSSRALVTSVEIGNEPGHYDDPFYRTVFENMARGLKEGDPRIQVATCATIDGKSHKYAKSLDCVKGLEGLYDVLNVHTYAEIEGWPTWRRSFPEDSSISYLKDVQKIVDWRNVHAKGKPVWITEFGWDSSTKKPEPKGTFAKWVGVTDLQQAQYLVRSTLVFMTLDVARAYIYFYDDNDEASVHAASGLTRKFEPKPSYHAVAHLQKTLGGHRLARVRSAAPGGLHLFEFEPAGGAGKRILVAWSGSGSGREAETELDLGGLRVTRAERMPVAAGEAPVEAPAARGGKTAVLLTESPLYLWLE
jgi:serine/threonine-protein kinase ATR